MIDRDENSGDDQDAVAAIVAGCQAGDRDAQRRLYELFHQQVYRLMARMVGLADAADLTQQVFLQVFRKIGQFSGDGHFGGWLRRVAMNEAYQHFRRNKRREHVALAHEPTDQMKPAPERVEQREAIEQALARLEPDLRSLFLLREMEGQSYREIAEILGIPEGTVGSRLNRARRELQEHLIALGYEP